MKTIVAIGNDIINVANITSVNFNASMPNNQNGVEIKTSSGDVFGYTGEYASNAFDELVPEVALYFDNVAYLWKDIESITTIDRGLPTFSLEIKLTTGTVKVLGTADIYSQLEFLDI